MFKTSVSILLIMTCIFMQYARQLAYLECKIENISSKQPVCDCEKKYDNELNKESGQVPQQKNHIHVSLDEFDVPDENCITLIAIYQDNNYLNRETSSLSSYKGIIFRPPKS